MFNVGVMNVFIEASLTVFTYVTSLTAKFCLFYRVPHVLVLLIVWNVAFGGTIGLILLYILVSIL